MVIVPREVLEGLVSKVNEDNGKKPFDFDDFLKTVDHESKINKYLADKDISFVGTGTSRTAYLIPKGSCNDAKNVPVCFKVAKNIAGIKQNMVEHQIVGKYGKNEDCFAKLYKYDTNRNLCLESEIGSRLSEFDLDKYFEDWNKFMTMAEKNSTRGFVDGLKKLVSMMSKANRMRRLDNALRLTDIGSLFDILFMVKDFRKLGADLAEYKRLAEKYVKIMLECGIRYKKYSGLASLMHVLFEQGGEAELRIGEFNDPANFAMVYRGETDPVMIPIDYGITEKVFQDFYGNNAKEEYFKDLGNT